MRELTQIAYCIQKFFSNYFKYPWKTNTFSVETVLERRNNTYANIHSVLLTDYLTFIYIFMGSKIFFLFLLEGYAIFVGRLAFIVAYNQLLYFILYYFVFGAGY
jgi:hypothetical protein